MKQKKLLKEVRVFAPASVANVSCGFDVMGFALNKPGDEIVARRTEKAGVKIVKVTGDDGVLPLSETRNTAGVAAGALIEHVGYQQGVELEVHKKMPLGSGLGSSAASSVGAAVAVNKLFGNPLKAKELLPFVAKGERIACGSAHLDNVAPSLLGGFVFIRTQEPPDVFELACPVPLFATVIHPHIEVRTEDTRKILRRDVSLRKAITQWGNVGGLVAGLLKGDYELISSSLQDVIIEPVRSVIIPGFKKVKNAAMKAGALGSSISGSGPSIFALSSSKEKAEDVGNNMEKAFCDIGLANEVYISEVNQRGPQILEAK